MSVTASHLVKPSCSRTVWLTGFVPVARASAAQAVVPLAWPAKDPADILDYRVDASQAVIGNEGDSIATMTVTITPDIGAALALTQSMIDGMIGILWLEGGESGTTYSVTVNLVTINGRVIQRSVSLPVTYLSTVTAPSGALQTNDGAPVVDQNGNPILTPD